MTRPSNRHIHSAVLPRLSGEELAGGSGYPCFARSLARAPILHFAPLQSTRKKMNLQRRKRKSAFHIPSPVFRDECGIPRPFLSSPASCVFPECEELFYCVSLLLLFLLFVLLRLCISIIPIRQAAPSWLARSAVGDPPWRTDRTGNKLLSAAPVAEGDPTDGGHGNKEL